jgi:hypothetical protein
MLEMILIAMIAIGTVGAVAQGAPARETCTDKIVRAVPDSELIPGYIEACEDKAMRASVMRCKSRKCILDAIDYEDGAE